MPLRRTLCRRMTKKESFSVMLLFLIFLFFLNPKESHPEFYKYRDKNGKVHYVDSKSKIPKEYRKDLTTYEEKYDHLSEEEKEKRIAEDRQKLEEERQRKEARQEQLRKELEEKERLAQEALLERQEQERREEEKIGAKSDREKFLENFESKVIIDGIHTLVPCTLGYKDKEIEVHLLLDTGCTTTVIHKQAAKRLKFKGSIKRKALIAGGGTINMKTGKLSHFKVGPYKLDDFYVNVMEYNGPKIKHEGLLGMNFLAGRKYNIDYRNRVIRWVP